MTKKLFSVIMGDWSGDGHSQSEIYYVSSNYSGEEMRQAYKDTCKKIGLQLNHNANYTDIKQLDEWRSGEQWRQLLTEYEQSSISEEAVEILLEHGFDFSRVDGERDEIDRFIVQEAYFDSESVFDLFMWFISYSMPEDFKYEQFKIDAEPINGWGNGLNHQIGYGIYY